MSSSRIHTRSAAKTTPIGKALNSYRASICIEAGSSRIRVFGWIGRTVGVSCVGRSSDAITRNPIKPTTTERPTTAPTTRAVRVLDGTGTRCHRSAASDGSRGGATSTPFTERTAQTRTSPGTPFSRRSPRSWKSIPAPGTRSLRTEETTISPGPPIAPTLAPVWTATPPTFPPINSASPTCRPARTSRPISRTPSTISTAHRMDSACRSKTAKNPSPAVSSSFPPWRRRACRTIRLCASSSTFHRPSPTARAMSLDPTMSVKGMVTSFGRLRRDMSGVSSSRI